MEVEIENSTNLEELRLKKRFELELSEEATIGELLSELDLNRLKEEDGSLSSLVMVFKNKKAVRSVDEKLSEGDKIKIMPLASGG
ncbi:hypothetical protein AKJ38_02015 [candidate division MSBL1 archaeon SCGC-AAA259I14]|uniref:MoaD/ThiS family protein n=2 Tax=candidate division MSBL1 TaxID=215777 RepID=A0A133US56_9EURY|nr:hypothetical protein AKJ61_02540 [candidate division MSBL1 archaeon SCGC-AAA259B11]KXA97071.1 hypothetical protein AKJ38_02015 [candidate division MSBL1 archaeon SCGC-AAA259I14]